MKNIILGFVGVLMSIPVFAGGGITGSNLSCGISTSQSLTNSGFSGSNATSTTGSCGQCCYQGSDLDSDGDADVNFSVENAQWYQYCNPSGTASLTIDFIVDETNNNCNLQGAVFVTSSTTSAGTTDALDIDCSNQEYAQFGSGVSGNADGFSFTGVTIPPGGCAFLMVDGYGGATCGAYTVNVVCPPLCTNPTTFTAGPDQAICEGSSILLNSTVSGGTTTAPGLSYSWTPTTGLSCTTCADPTASPTATTTYTMTACNGGPGFCCVTDQVVVTVTPNFVANAGTDITACAPSTVTIGGAPTGPAGSTYAWVVSGTNNTGIAISGSTTVANPTVTISAGATGSETYQVTVTNGPCIRTDLVTVTVGPLAVNAGLDQIICLGSTVNIGGAPTAPAGSTFSWSPSAGLSSSSIANPSFTAGSTTTFTVTATLGTCSNTDQVVVTVNPLPTTPTATASINPICAGQSVTLTAAGGAGTGTYSWWTASTGGTNLGSSNTLTVNPTGTTTYYVQSTDATTGCVSARGSITVTVNPTPVANAGTDQTLCVGEVATLAGTITNAGACSPIQTWSIVSGTGSFSNVNSLTSTFTPTSSGTITLQLTPCSPGGCTPVSDQITLTVSPSPVVTASVVTNPICVGLITDLVGTVTGGNPFDPDTTYQTFTSGAGPYTIPDNNTSGVSIPINVSGVPNSTLGTTTVSMVGLNVDHNRIGQVEVWLCPPGITPTPTAFPGCIQLFNNTGGNGDDLINTIVADYGSVDIDAGAPPYSGTFNPTGTNSLNGLSGPTNGTWTVVVIDNSNAGATSGTAGQMSITFGTPVPVDPYTYSWSPSTNLSSTNTESTSLSTTGLTAPSTVNYTLTATDENGCTVSATVTVDVIGPPTATAGSDQNVCSTPATLAGNNPSSGTTGLWTLVSGAGTISDPTQYNSTISGLGAGTNVFQWTLTNSCGSASDQVSITSTPPTSGTLNGGSTICVGNSTNITLTFSGVGPTYDFTYSNGTSNTNVNNVSSPYILTVSPSSNTTYTLVSMNDDGSTCPESVSGSALITVNPINTVSSASSSPSLCLNTPISPTITFSTSGATGIGAASGLPAGVSTSFIGNTISVSGTPSVVGTFNYSIPLTGGCGNISAAGTITVNDLNTVSTPSSNPTLCINTSISPVISFATTGATGIGVATNLPTGVSASYLNNTITVSGTPTNSGTFNYSIPLSGGCGSITATGTITVNPLNTVTPASSNPTLCVNTALPSSITFTTTGATGIGSATGLPAGVSASWFGNTITISGTPTASGTFNYTIPLTGGCGAVNATGTITVVDVPVISLTPDDPNTCNASDGSILVSGTGTGTITWAGPTSGNASGLLNYTIPNLGAGTYSVYFTNATGCQSSTLQTSLANPGAPIIDVINDVTNCGTSYTLPSISGSSLINPQYYTAPAGGGTVIAVGTVYNVPTILTLYAYDVNGSCSDEEPFTITINEIPSLNPVTSVSGCPGSVIDPTDFSSTPAGATFSWTNDNIAVGIPSLGNGQIATYIAPANATNADVIGTVTVTPTLNGCVGSSSSFTITILPTPTINAFSNVSGCPGSLVEPDDFVSVPAGATFAWSNSNTNIGLAASGTDQITPFNLGNNNTANAITGTISATATLNGCTSAPLTFTISINPTPVITLTPTDPSSCNGTDGSILVNTGAPGSVSWSGTSIGTSGPMNSNYSITNLGAGSYDVTFTNSSTGCQSAVVSTSLLNPGAPIINPISDITQCGGSYTLPAISGTSLINAQYYTQPNGGGGIVSEGTLFEPDTVITLYAYDANGACTTTESFTINLTSIPVITNPGAQIACDGYTLGTFSGTNIFAPTYWSQTGGQGTQLNIGDVISTNSTVYIYDQNGACTSEESFDITIIQTPSINNPGNQVACESYSLPVIAGSDLSGSQGYFNNSQALGGTALSGSITNSQTVYIYDANGACSDEESFVVSINPLPSATISGGATYCQGDAISAIVASLTGTPNYTVNYTLDGVTQSQTGSSTTLSLGNLAGTYVLVSITDANCTNSNLSSTQTIVINPIPNAPTAGTDTLYCDNATPVDMFAQGTGSFTWYADQSLTSVLGTNSTYTPSMNLGSTNYYVTETNNGCEGHASLVTITVEECDIIVPTAFTPDNDGVNETWVLENIDQIYPENVVSIYNRWGNLIFQSKTGQYETNPWDGKYNNEKMPVGSYYFIIDYNDGQTDNKTGIVTLINNKG